MHLVDWIAEGGLTNISWSGTEDPDLLATKTRWVDTHIIGVMFLHPVLVLSFVLPVLRCSVQGWCSEWLCVCVCPNFVFVFGSGILQMMVQ